MGVAGSGISAVAAIAAYAGFKISGCDLNLDSEYLSGLKSGLQFQCWEGHDPGHLQDVDLLIITPAVTSLDPKNKELLEAKKKKIPILTWQEFMGWYLQQDKFVIAVAGTHGKSTTTAMIGLILEKAGLDPTVEVGAIVPEWGRNFRLGGDRYFVCEADEFNDNFLNYHPDIVVITNVEMDHPEYFANLAAVKKSFAKFVGNLKPGGFLVDQGKLPADTKLRVPGGFNRQNAALAWKVAARLGVDDKIICQTLEEFTGLGRRFEFKGEALGARIYDDYAHHPTAIKVTLEAARQKFPHQKIWLVFQPHMFSRTKYLFDDFVKVLQEAPVDKIIILDIFPAREKDRGLVSSRELVSAVGKKDVQYPGRLEEAVRYLTQNIKKGDIVINMGAGDIYRLSPILLLIGKLGKDRIVVNEPMASHTTFRIGGPADLFYEAETKEKLIKAVQACRQLGIPYFILGGGSNILVSDKGIRGMAIKIVNSKWQIVNSKIIVEAGMSLPYLVQEAAQKSLSGLEICAGIPGTVGGAIVGNAGTKTEWISQLVEEVEVVDQGGKVTKVFARDCQFGYRKSRFQNSQEIILSVVLGLTKDNSENIERRMTDYLQARASQPKGASAGSVFKNPSVDLPAGQLIEEAGLKGKQIGKAQISEAHANFIVNLSADKAGLGGATCRDVLELIRLAKQKVAEKFGVKLEEEIKIVGEF